MNYQMIWGDALEQMVLWQSMTATELVKRPCVRHYHDHAAERAIGDNFPVFPDNSMSG